MKPKLSGNLAELYAAKTVIRRKTATFNGVEFVRCVDLRAYGRELYYEIVCAGINRHGVEIAAYFRPGRDTQYFWQIADKVAVNDVIANPASAYKWHDIKNGI